MKRGVFVLLLFFVGCEPHFQSGKTLCSDDGHCPSGFVCSDNGSGGAYTCVTMPSACEGQVGFYCKKTDTCWDSAVACSTVFNCGTPAAPDYQVCVSAGYHPDCNGPNCLPNSGGSGGAAGTGGTPGATTATGGAAGAGGTPGGTTGTGGAAGTGGTPGGTTGTGPRDGGVDTGVPDSALLDSAVPDSRSPDSALLDLAVPDSRLPDSALPDLHVVDTAAPDLRVLDTAVPDSRVPDSAVTTCPPPAAGGTCNVFPACGCPAGQVCYPDTPATGLTCETTAGLGQGAACNGEGCASGFGCFGGVCKTYCQSDSDCPAVDTARSCDQTTWDSVNTIAGVSVCARVCDPVNPQNPQTPLLACPAGFGCTAVDTSFPGATDCESQSGTGTTGSACAMDDDCTPGYYCSVGGTCIKYCYTVADCPVGATCISFTTPSYAGTTQVNHCHSP
ncbi:MAG: hypothetical protein WBP56_05910 [Polyangia bacterium]